MAERVGFEPTEPVKAHSISNAANSTTLAPFRILSGGEGGIRTHGTRKGTTIFETARFNHSRTSPRELKYRI
jgi:hypothetical protein